MFASFVRYLLIIHRRAAGRSCAAVYDCRSVRPAIKIETNDALAGDVYAIGSSRATRTGPMLSSSGVPESRYPSCFLSSLFPVSSASLARWIRNLSDCHSLSQQWSRTIYYSLLSAHQARLPDSSPGSNHTMGEPHRTAAGRARK